MSTLEMPIPAAGSHDFLQEKAPPLQSYRPPGPHDVGAELEALGAERDEWKRVALQNEEDVKRLAEQIELMRINQGDPVQIQAAATVINARAQRVMVALNDQILALGKMVEQLAGMVAALEGAKAENSVIRGEPK